MFDVGGITAGNTGSNSTPIISGKDGSVLDGDDFLMLLITEMQNQDPLEPMTNQEYMAQLTQLSSLDELTAIRDTLESQQSNAATTINAQSISMIGKEVVVGDSIVEYSGEEVDLRLGVKDGQAMTVSVYDTSGNAVREDTIPAGSHGGYVDYTFDGKNDDGATLVSGEYYIQVTDAAGTTAYPVYQVGRVTAVDFTGEATMLELANGQVVALANLVGVRE